MTAPKYATPRNPQLLSYGPRVGVVSAALGAPLMPWQQQVADVALEAVPLSAEQQAKHPTISHAWRYRRVIVTVPRQSGKTTLLRAIALDRALTNPGAQIFLTAQTGKDARARWRDWVKGVTDPGSPLAAAAQVRRAAGTEALTLPGGSFISPFAPTPKSLHGYTPPLVMIDEAWAFDEPGGVELEAAISPAQITLPHRQLWIVSTMGDASSTWFHKMVDSAREKCGDPNSDTAFFEWSADEEIDPYNPDVLEFHPAIGHTQTRDDLLAQAAKESPGNWRRGYLNLRTQTREAVVDMGEWDKLTAPAHDTPPLTECVIGYAVAADRSGSSIWAAHLTAGNPCVHLVATRTGSAWVAPTIADLYRRGPRLLVADDAGHTRTVTATLAADHIPVTSATPKDYATACSSLLGRIVDATIHHDAAPELRAQLEGAALKPLAGGRAFSEESSAGPIDHLKAATLAAFHVEHLPAIIPIW